MPRYKNEREFQLGEYWLSKQSRSDAWCRTWFDAQTRQTKRVSLRTAEFEEAKQRLTDWFVLRHSKSQEQPEDAVLAGIFARFYEHHGQTLQSAADVKRTLRYWLEFHKDSSVLEATQQIRQEEFRRWLSVDKGLSAASVRKSLIIGKSALNWAWKRGEISQVPYIELVKPPKPEPKGRPLEIREVAELMRRSKDHHVSVLIAFMLGTAARTAAILELNLQQVDDERGLIMLNPEGRAQTKKYRPTVRLPQQLEPYIRARKNRNAFEPLICYRSSGVASVKTAWNSIRKESKLAGNVQTYSFRHTMARWLRMKGVPAWEVASQLGHKTPEYSTTEIYAPYDPAHLSHAVEAIDDFLGQVACELRVKNLSEHLKKSM